MLRILALVLCLLYVSVGWADVVEVDNNHTKWVVEALTEDTNHLQSFFFFNNQKCPPSFAEFVGATEDYEQSTSSRRTFRCNAMSKDQANHKKSIYQMLDQHQWVHGQMLEQPSISRWKNQRKVVLWSGRLDGRRFWAECSGLRTM